jgi:dipeptidyl-peptidase-4
VKIGVVDAAGGATRWLAAGPDTGQYLARLAWAGADSVAVVRLPRAQDRLDLLMLSATTGDGRTVVTDRDSAYVDAEGDPVTWLPGGARFLLRTDRGGWRGFELYDRSGRLVRRVTPPGADYLELSGLDSAGAYGYFVAAAPTAAQRSVFRCAVAGAGAPACTRLTPERGSHALDVAPGRALRRAHGVAARRAAARGARVAPELRPVRALEDNRAVAARLAALDVAAPEFLTVPMPDGTRLDAYRVVPPRFDSTKAHPVLMHVYGGPASPQVNDAWGGTRYLWHQLMAQRGYVVLVVDNRGAAWRGRDFRKVTQLALGVRESQDQIDARGGRRRGRGPTRAGSACGGGATAGT